MQLQVIRRKQQQHPYPQVAVMESRKSRTRLTTVFKGLTEKNHKTGLKMEIPTMLLQPVRRNYKHQKQPPLKRMLHLSLATVTAAPRSPTPPPLFCFFFLLRVRLRLRWRPRESEGERAVHRPHTHSSFSHSLCVSPCMDSRPHLIPRGTHIMCPLYICMHTHAGPLVLSFARHAPLPSCLAAWAEHRNCFCFVFIALSGRPLSLSLPVCVFCFTGAMRVCALVVTRFGFFFFASVVVGCSHFTFIDWFS
ncbi:hypothetical protein ECC02_009393 [Trypanosoma cruzi]|uniref:Transmembrane protein n=1 Tax=Trypanosoma cruzi TaxID=5693 RepID=A0A7J6XUM1_TRYCR|nr:hypothetical protein ECC02_009393 [Trypanosoma cruzi]